MTRGTTPKAPRISSSKTKILTARESEPICALATPAGRSAVAVIRASGANIFDFLADIFCTRAGKTSRDLTPRRTYHGYIRSGDRQIDDVLFIRFDAPASFTGEDSFEIHCHGNAIVVEKILALLYRAGIRPARAGEFTRRAYLNGKLDIDAAQAVAEIIEARNEASLEAAQRLKAGVFRTSLLALRSNLMNLLADLNAELDFIDEDIAFSTAEKKLETVAQARNAVTELANNAERFDFFRSGVQIAIVGKPNAGKSSLMNRLLGHERSIVSDRAGTTRDYIEAELTLAGFNVRLFDTAGLNENSHDSVERLGIERTRALIEQAHVCIHLVDGSQSDSTIVALQNLRPDAVAITVVNKADILHADGAYSDRMRISAKTGAGIDQLLDELAHLIASRIPAGALPLQEWQIQILRRIAGHLDACSAALVNNELPEIITHTVQRAVDCIAELTGAISSEDILGRIFSRFCIGK